LFRPLHWNIDSCQLFISFQRVTSQQMPISQNLKYIIYLKKRHINTIIIIMKNWGRIVWGWIDRDRTALGPDWFGAGTTRNKKNDKFEIPEWAHYIPFFLLFQSGEIICQCGDEGKGDEMSSPENCISMHICKFINCWEWR
jgi:hypothetical protein